MRWTRRTFDDVAHITLASHSEPTYPCAQGQLRHIMASFTLTPPCKRRSAPPPLSSPVLLWSRCRSVAFPHITLTHVHDTGFGLSRPSRAHVALARSRPYVFCWKKNKGCRVSINPLVVFSVLYLIREGRARRYQFGRVPPCPVLGVPDRIGTMELVPTSTPLSN